MNAPAALSSDCDRAFPPHARTDRYFPASSIEGARRRVVDCATRGDGPAIVVGPAGVGKTMLMEVLAAEAGDSLRVVKLASSQLCTRRALLQAILFGLDLPYREREEGEIRLALQQALEDSDLIPRAVLLLVDEAQSLPPKLLEELRVLSNIARGGMPVLRLVLFGGPGLEDVFAMPELETFNQRLGARCYLSAMSYDETREYARAHVAAVGGDPNSVFTSDGLDAVFHASDGIARLASQVCDRALATAVAEGVESVDGQVVQNAWSDLHQLPAPWPTAQTVAPSEAPEESVEECVVEFGALEELDGLLDVALDVDDAVVDEAPLAIAALAPDPGADMPESPSTESDKPDDGAVWNADQALREIGSARCEEPTPVDEEPVDKEDGDPLFGGGFVEEEIVIDHFASLDAVFHDNTPQVTNSEDPQLSLMAETLSTDEASIEEMGIEEGAAPEAPAAEYELEEEAIELEEEVEIAVHPDVAISTGMIEELEDCQSPTLSISDLELAAEVEELDIILVDDDLDDCERVARPMVQRKEYRRLFAQLRRG